MSLRDEAVQLPLQRAPLRGVAASLGVESLRHQLLFKHHMFKQRLRVPRHP